MTTVLHLGVADLPYAGEPVKRRGKKPKIAAGTQTTGDVADILERRYGLMQAFFDQNAQFVADQLANSLAGTLETVMQGGPPASDPFAGAEAAIDARFRDALTRREFDGLIPGVPTAAAAKGTSHRFKGKRGAAGRPSFIDTGLLQSAFKSWLDTNR